MPSNKQNTAVIEGRCDHRDLATCHEWLSQRGVFANTKSALFGEIVGQMATLIREKLGGRAFDNHEALIYLQRTVGTVNRSDRGKRTMSEALQGEALDIDLVDRIEEVIKQRKGEAHIGERLVPKVQDKEAIMRMLQESGTLKEGGESE